MTRFDRLQKTGIRRLGNSRTGFRYAKPSGRPSAEDRKRIDALKIPPAWKEVAIATSARAPLQAVGQDAAGRWQYLYHDAFVKKRERDKFERLLRFAKALPHIRRAVARDLARSELAKERVLAALVRILARTYIRPGNEAYAQANGSYGLTTLRHRHVTRRGTTLTFRFRGKGGQEHEVTLRDRAVARVAKELEGLPGTPFFRFRLDDGRLAPVSAALLNAYLKEIAGGPFTAKDFRTWGGTLVCAAELAGNGPVPSSERERRRMLEEAIRRTAASLRNTPAVSLSSYISPRVVLSFENGKVLRTGADSRADVGAVRSLAPSEEALLEILQSR